MVFIPNNVVNLILKENANYPYIWSLLTCVFIEENLAMLGVFFALANYIVIQNRASLEQAWNPKEFIKMISICGTLSSVT